MKWVIPVVVALAIGVATVAILSNNSAPKVPANKAEAPVNLASHPDPPDILCDSKPFTPDDLQTAAIQVLYPRLLHPSRFDASTEAVGRARTRSAEVRKWVNASIDNARVKAAYVDWLDYYAKDYDDIESYIVKGVRKDPQEEEHDREQKEKQARAEALAKCLPVPPERTK